MSDETASQDVWQRLFDLAPADPLSVNDLRAMYAAIDEIERLRSEIERLGGLIFTYVNEKHNDDLWAHEGLRANATARQSSAVRASNAYAALVDEYRKFHP